MPKEGTLWAQAGGQVLLGVVQAAFIWIRPVSYTACPDAHADFRVDTSNGSADSKGNEKALNRVRKQCGHYPYVVKHGESANDETKFPIAAQAIAAAKFPTADIFGICGLVPLCV